MSFSKFFDSMIFYNVVNEKFHMGSALLRFENNKYQKNVFIFRKMSTQGKKVLD